MYTVVMLTSAHAEGPWLDRIFISLFLFLAWTLITSQVKLFLSHILVVLGNVLMQQQVWDKITYVTLQTVPSILEYLMEIQCLMWIMLIFSVVSVLLLLHDLRAHEHNKVKGRLRLRILNLPTSHERSIILWTVWQCYFYLSKGC